MLETSNPNRSVLINKSLINSKKHISEEELSDEFSFDQTPHDIINGSLLGSIRSNLLETAERGVSENTTRRDRSNNLSLDMNKAITSENRNPTNEKENIKGIGSHTGHAQSSLENLINTKTRIPFLAKPKTKPDMKLNLSKIVKANSFDRGPLGFESMSYADFQKNDFKKNDNIQNPKMDFPPPTITTTNRSQPNRENKFSLPVTTENERANTDSVKFSANQTLNSFVNQLESGRPISSYRITFQNESLSLNEAYEGLKRVSNS